MTWRNIGDDPTLEGYVAVIEDGERALGGVYAIDVPGDAVEVDVHRADEGWPVPQLSTESTYWSNRLQLTADVTLEPLSTLRALALPKSWLFWDGEGWLDEHSRIAPGPRALVLLDGSRIIPPPFEHFTP